MNDHGKIEQRLIEHGAVTIVVPGSPPFGCASEHLTLAKSSNKEDYDPLTGCFKKGNEFAHYHNNLLERELDRLRELHPHCTIIYADYYNAAMEVFLSPHQYGKQHSFSYSVGLIETLGQTQKTKKKKH